MIPLAEESSKNRNKWKYSNHIHTHTDRHRLTHTHTHTRARARARTHARTHRRTYTHKHARARAHARTNAGKHTNKQRNTGFAQACRCIKIHPESFSFCHKQTIISKHFFILCFLLSGQLLHNLDFAAFFRSRPVLPLS